MPKEGNGMTESTYCAGGIQKAIEVSQIESIGDGVDIMMCCCSGRENVVRSHWEGHSVFLNRYFWRDFKVEGNSYRVHVDTCYLRQEASIREMVDLVSTCSHRKIFRKDELDWRLSEWGYSPQLLSREHNFFERLNPFAVWDAHGQTYFTLRDVVRLLPARHRCVICGLCGLRSRGSSIPDYVCSARNYECYFKYQKKKDKEKKWLKTARQRLMETRAYLRNQRPPDRSQSPARA